MNIEHNLRLVEYANFRPATDKEKQEARGGVLWRIVTCPLQTAYKVLGSWEIYQKGPNTLTWQKPRLQSFVERISLWMGYHPEHLFMRSIFSFFGNRHLLEGNREILKAFFDHHRQDEIFTNSRSSQKFYELVQKIFPEEKFSEEDFMMTCLPEKTKMYRSLLHVLLKGSHLNQMGPQIQKTAQLFIHNWVERSQQGEEINVTEETRLFTSSIITQLMFNASEHSADLAKSVDFINYFMIKSLIKVTEEDKAAFGKAIDTFRRMVEMILEKENIPLFNQTISLSSAQKKLMIFTLLFAGQETTASLLTYILWKLAVNPDLQDEIHQQIKRANSNIPPEKLVQQLNVIKDLFAKSIREFTPAYGVGRTLREDECLEFRFQGETEIRKRILPKGDMVIARMIKVAEQTPLAEPLNYQNWFPFGGGPHRCPGEQLAIQEISQFIFEILSNYTIDTKQTHDIPKVGHVTLKLAEDLYIRLKSRHSYKSHDE